RPSDAYATIWLHLGRMRSGYDDRQEFTQNSSRLDHTKWPMPIIDFYQGASSPDPILAAAASALDPKSRDKQACEAHFYIGAVKSEKGDKTEGRRLLQAAVGSCSLNSIEWMARAELSRLAGC